ncbi:putative guanylyl cyclase receptor, partial [Operophtera brumata]
ILDCTNPRNILIALFHGGCNIEQHNKSPKAIEARKRVFKSSYFHNGGALRATILEKCWSHVLSKRFAGFLSWCFLIGTITITYGEVFTLGYLTGSQRRPGDYSYQRPGRVLSGVAALWAANVSAFIGPQETCVHEGRMAAAFNLPMISYVSFIYLKAPNHDFSRLALAIIAAAREKQISVRTVQVYRQPFYYENRRENFSREYAAIGVDVDKYDSEEAVRYLAGPLRKEPAARTLRAFRSYLAVAPSPSPSYPVFAK